MKIHVLRLLTFVATSLHSGVVHGSQLTVQTSTGSFTGLIDPKYPHVRQFRAIPFAEPPVGSRRWLPPQKLSAQPNHHRFSTKFPPSCPQFVTAIESMWNMNITKGNLIYNGAQNDTSGLAGEATSEDCLHLAIWTPPSETIPAEGLPVLFFMTGGGFIIGGVDLPWQIPTSWVERSKSHIVVSINYRVNIFGFPSARGLEQQNLGILDQRAALEWVRDNIASFGGDPQRITQWGRSAGAIAADIHAYAYYEDPIAQAYYLESGTVFSVAPAPPAYANFSFVARNVGCTSPCGGNCTTEEESQAELDCMRQVSATQITNFIGQYGDRGAMPPLAFGLVADDSTIFSDYKARSEAGQLARAPTMISFTANEFSSLVPWPANNLTGGPDQSQVTAGTVAFGVCATYNSTSYRNRLIDDAPVFRFQYAAEFPNLNVYKWLGAYHNSETTLIFGTYGILDNVANSTDFQDEVSYAMQDRILAFASDPYHGPQSLGWAPQVTDETGGGTLIRFGGSSGDAVSQVSGDEVDGVCMGTGQYNPFP
ncbi:hypothetical protein CAC42_3631 [Sphaceloma murrayae]|uniref:Carboxylesterase type B domain-containing protein n=1 Tax=Sphaceloma murrayae TaxID=2082308 RepID=A0A2K1QSV8_9PEZI|nr:hypothetical protein CAC42_3631 [Sphaceloma murrayae]